MKLGKRGRVDGEERAPEHDEGPRPHGAHVASRRRPGARLFH